MGSTEEMTDQSMVINESIMKNEMSSIISGASP